MIILPKKIGEDAYIERVSIIELHGYYDEFDTMLIDISVGTDGYEIRVEGSVEKGFEIFEDEEGIPDELIKHTEAIEKFAAVYAKLLKDTHLIKAHEFETSEDSFDGLDYVKIRIMSVYTIEFNGVPSDIVALSSSDAIRIYNISCETPMLRKGRYVTTFNASTHTIRHSHDVLVHTNPVANEFKLSQIFYGNIEETIQAQSKATDKP